MFYLTVFLLLTICLVLFFFAFQYFFSPNAPKYSKKTTTQNNSSKKTSKCVICGSILQNGETLTSKIYPSSNGTDQRCIINGCPHCQPFCKPGVFRHCPVCGKIIPPEGYLIARMFIKKEGKNHVHVVGCSECHKKF